MKLWRRKWPAALLLPAALIYRGIVEIRLLLYRLKVKQSKKFEAYTISIGNITVGGTGKTPLVCTVAEILQKAGISVAILSRGYGRKSQKPVIVSDGREVLVPTEESGDEPALFAHTLRDVPIIVGAKRRLTGALGVQRFRPQVLLLDDAFQHWQVKRNLDIVTLDAGNPWGNGWIMPAGPLRESLFHLKRADMIVLTRTDESKALPSVIQKAQQYTEAPIFESVHAPSEFIPLAGGESHPLESMRGRRALIFSGIGNPGSFRHTLEGLGVHILDEMIFSDHQWYDEIVLTNLLDRRKAIKADVMITTEKDGMRIGAAEQQRLHPCYLLKIQLKFNHPDDFEKELIRRICVKERGVS